MIRRRMLPQVSFSRYVLAAVAALVCAAVGSVATRACDTPVYRYAMYRWHPSDYLVLYLYRGSEAAEDQAANARLKALSEEVQPRANLAYFPIDFDKQEESLKLFPPFLRDNSKQLAEDTLPRHVVLPPVGSRNFAPIFSGRIEEGEIDSMIDSPARQDFSRQLANGKSSVMLILDGKDAEANRRAENEVRELIRRATGGEIADFSLGAAGLLPASPDEGALDVGIVKVDRHDPQEVWFVRSLLGLEDDLHELDGPMVFGMYGRGRALEPYVGEGITADNLADVVAFLIGDCSCQVKEENPGRDLLVRWDWDAAAANLAALVGEEEGNEQFLLPEQLLPSLVASVGGGLPDPAVLPDEQIEEQQVVASAAGHDPPAASSVAPASSESSGHEEPVKVSEVPGALRQNYGVGLGVALGLAAIGLAFVGFLFLQARSG